MFEHILLPVDMLTVGMNYLKLLVVLSHELLQTFGGEV